ncbi:polynucleotidyl transferase, ribonuclease H-like superfamily protein isoform X2 [Tasmannia lanceolata]
MAFARVWQSYYTSLSRTFPILSTALGPSSLWLPSTRNFNISASISFPPPTPILPLNSQIENHWKPMCLYYTQGLCTKMNDPMHLDKFNHDCSKELPVNAATQLKYLRSQHLDYFLVLDLEGRVEILEFPVIVIDAKSLNFVDCFHRFVKPTKMSEHKINEYIEGKYGKFGVDRVWHDTAIPFKEVLQQFEAWITHHQLWKKDLGGSLHQAAFVTCGNWDLKTKVPQQCKVSGIEIPPYFMEWINLKDIYLNFYKKMATGMWAMMTQLGMPLVGSHHLGIDDTKNIARVLQRMLADGAILEITARRSKGRHDVEFLFENRVR